MRKSLLLICMLLIASAAGAQNNTASWDNLSALAAGEKIQVRAVNAVEVTGGFVSVSDTSITVQAGAGAQTIQRQDVRRVRRMKNKHRLRNTLVAAGIGAGAGAGISSAAWENHGFAGGKGTGAAVGAVIGGLGGAIVGALLPGHATIYVVKAL